MLLDDDGLDAALRQVVGQRRAVQPRARDDDLRCRCACSHRWDRERREEHRRNRRALLVLGGGKGRGPRVPATGL